MSSELTSHQATVLDVDRALTEKGLPSYSEALRALQALQMSGMQHPDFAKLFPRDMLIAGSVVLLALKGLRS